MNVLVIGRGGREHALVWKIKQSPLVKKVYCATGNSGIGEIAERVNILAENIDELVAFAKKHDIGLTVVGPEIALSNGIVDKFEKEGLKIFGPSKAAVRLEDSKAFAKNIMSKYNIPSSKFAFFSDEQSAFEYIDKNRPPFIIKANGMDSGEAFIVAKDEITARVAVQVTMKDKAFGEAGSQVIIEESLSGAEAGIVAFTDGNKILSAVSTGIYKRAHDGDRGPFTGGMGAYSPNPKLSDAELEKIKNTILQPTIDAMNKENCKLKGILYMDIILTESGPKVVEFLVRFNDPATQAVLPRLKTDLVEIMLAICENKTDNLKIEWDSRSTVEVVLVSGDYPRKYDTGKPITGLETITKSDEVIIFHAGTANSAGRLVSAGGRVIDVVGISPSLNDARKKAYAEVEKIYFKDIRFRKDIGQDIIEFEKTRC
ncbi:MAG: phosphoribosylamine--glycine ligase [Candidatus Wallbacteria bacterium]